MKLGSRCRRRGVWCSTLSCAHKTHEHCGAKGVRVDTDPLTCGGAASSCICVQKSCTCAPAGGCQQHVQWAALDVRSLCLQAWASKNSERPHDGVFVAGKTLHYQHIRETGHDMMHN